MSAKFNTQQRKQSFVSFASRRFRYRLSEAYVPFDECVRHPRNITKYRRIWSSRQGRCAYDLHKVRIVVFCYAFTLEIEKFRELLRGYYNLTNGLRNVANILTLVRQISVIYLCTYACDRWCGGTPIVTV